jgi:hypothetical protein
MLTANSVNGAMPGLTLKAWAQVKADGTLIRNFNVTSITKGSTGGYTVNFTVAMGTSTYIARVTGSPLVGDTQAFPLGVHVQTRSTAALQLGLGENGSGRDLDFFVEVYE